MKKTLLANSLLSLALISLLGLAACGGGSSSGVSGTSGGGTTGTTGATGPNSVLSGKYAFSFTGTATNNGDPLFLAGSFTADGNGNLTAGVEDINQLGTTVTKAAAFTGTYTIGTDGRGTLNFTGSVTQTFKIVVENNNHGQLMRFDSGAAGSGTFDLQNTSAFSLSSLQGNFAFEWNGNANQTNGPLFSGVGAINLSSGAASGAIDVNEEGTYTSTTATGNLQAPDSNGHGVATITYGSTLFTYGYDIISANRIILIEMDSLAATVGEADLQSSNLTLSSFSGNYAFYLNEIQLGFGMVGQMTTDGQGNILSSDSEEINQNVPASGTFPGTYAVGNPVLISGANVNAYGRFTMTATEPTLFIDHFVVYLVSPSQAFIMETDSDQFAFGQLVAQTGSPYTSSSFNGNYGINFSGVDPNSFEADFVGQITSGGAATLTGGTLDINYEDLKPPTVANNAISAGSYSIVNNTTGRSSIAFTVAGVPLTFAGYLVSPNQIFLLEIDGQFYSIGSALTQPTIP
jgi:hypothetical protein